VSLSKKEVYLTSQHRVVGGGEKTNNERAVERS